MQKVFGVACLSVLDGKFVPGALYTCQIKQITVTAKYKTQHIY